MNGTLTVAAVATALTLVACSTGGGSQTGAETAIPGATSSADPSAESAAESSLAAIEPGMHSAESFWPPLTFTVPDGWLTEPAAEGFVPLVPDMDENRERTEAGGPPLTFLYVLSNMSVAAENCEDAAQAGVGPTASDIVGALATRPGLSTNGPVSVTVGGLSGQQLDATLPEGSTATCPQGGSPFVPLVYSPDFIFWGAEPGEQFRITVLDVAGLPSGMYATVMIIVYSADASVWDDHVSASTDVVESFVFDTTSPHP